ncbi:hypothetical protein HEP81_06040 [Streptomyces griseofuscus]|uniref:MarR family transcriptional regulator n=1 Tax=Streptomyces griseofuscus TaxID=146922 RepID=A0A7H1Q7K7_9ACTN|nr:hypothetical protein HEP81_06040 [Streptomyces griseofuscus]BBC96912.1 MarR family transcriptional regulator [Streptomyces rochei]
MAKQAASRLVDEVVRRGYAELRPHPGDARARLIVLTERGRACTRAAEAAAEVVGGRRELLGETEVRALWGEFGEALALWAGAARVVTARQAGG